MIKKYTIYLLLPIFLFSCKKEHKITIQAQNLITGDGSDYANMPFVVLQSRPAWNKDKVKRVYEGTLDQNGQASFFLKMNRNWSYTLNIEHPENLCYGGDLIEFLDNDSNNDVVIDYLKCGYFRLLIKNVNCEGPNDEFRFKFYHSLGKDIYIYRAYTTGSEFEWSENRFLEGCYDNTNSNDDSAVDIPEGNYIIEWEVRRTSGTTTGSDTFYIAANDTTTHILEY